MPALDVSPMTDRFQFGAAVRSRSWEWLFALRKRLNLELMLVDDGHGGWPEEVQQERYGNETLRTETRIELLGPPHRLNPPAPTGTTSWLLSVCYRASPLSAGASARRKWPASCAGFPVAIKTESHQTAVAWRPLWPPPHIAEKYLVGEHRESGRELYCSSLTFPSTAPPCYRGAR